MKYVALFTRAWIEMQIQCTDEYTSAESPSSRGRGLKSDVKSAFYVMNYVALFTRAWIEMYVQVRFAGVSICRPLHEGVD